MSKQSVRKAKISSVISSNKWLTYSGIVCTGALCLLTLAFLCPVANDGVNATDDTSTVGNQQSRANTPSSVSVSLQNAVDFDITPSMEGTFGVGTADLKVSTNSSHGYSVYMKTGNEESTLASDEGHTVAAISGTKTPAEFTRNTWGYALGKDIDTNTVGYRAVPTDITKPVTSVYTSSGDATEVDTYTLAFGAKVDTTLPSGRYANNVIVSVIANPEAVTMKHITSMQEMVPEICAKTPEGYEKQLIDERDQKSYYVAKLKDGNCWMTQNLAYDLVAGTTLTSEDTDLGNDGTDSEWTVPTTTETKIPEKETDPKDSARSWDLGEVVLNNPTGSSSCGNISSGSTITNCKWYTNVSGMTEGYNATLASSINDNKYDGHYLVGNYYQWSATTAQSGDNLDAPEEGSINKNELVDAPNSICPKGWRLPTSGAYRNGVKGDGAISYPYEREGSFESLFKAYGYPGEGDGAWYGASNPYTGITDGTRTRLDYKPLFFVRSGAVYPNDGSFHYPSLNGLYWASTAYPGAIDNSYYFTLDTGAVFPAGFAGRFIALSARCLAR